MGVEEFEKMKDEFLIHGNSINAVLNSNLSRGLISADDLMTLLFLLNRQNNILLIMLEKLIKEKDE